MTGDEPGGPGRSEPHGATPAGPPRVPSPRSAADRGARPAPGAQDPPGRVPAPRAPSGAPSGAPHGGPDGEPDGEPDRGPDRGPHGEPDRGPDEPRGRHDPAGGEADPNAADGTDGPAEEHAAWGAEAVARPRPGPTAPGPTAPGARAAEGDAVRGPHPQDTPPDLGHGQLTSLLGAWALGACRPDEAAAVETHLNGCPPCAEEADRLRDAVPLLEPQRTLDLDPALRPEVLADCLERRPAQLPVPPWAQPYEAETARLDALLHDMVEEEWLTPVRLAWFSGDSPVGRSTTVGGVVDHLTAVDGLLGPVLGLADPLGDVPAAPGPTERTSAWWQRTAAGRRAAPRRGWQPWRDQTRALVRAAGLLASRSERPVAYGTPEGFGGGELSPADAFLDRAFACWVHAQDIAEAVDYPYAAPRGPQLRMLVDLAARRLPVSIAGRRRAGLTSSPVTLGTAGEPGRSLHLEVEGAGGGHWYIPLDSPTAIASSERAVAHVALEAEAFCRLAAGRIIPDEAAAGGDGDPRAIRDVLFATAALSRL